MTDRIKTSSTDNAGAINSNSKEKIDLSIVIPIYNERESVDRLYKKLDKSLLKLGIDYEVIFIDDGSVDGTYNKLLEIHKKNSSYKIIRFRR
ncbi:unnamed protein product, partial [marine sediment metagenome]